MKVTVNWLREVVDTALSTSEIVERLIAVGMDVEGIEERGRELAGVVVGEVVRVDPHPRADRLVVCQVRVAASATLQIVCGARNMKAGDHVALATEGTQMPDGRRIEATELRGVRSEGMLCSAAELGLGEATDGILILPPATEVGQPLAEALGIADTVIELSVTPNRGDCLSVLGIARELAASTGAKLSRRRAPLRERGVPAAELVAVRIADPDLCGRYAARVITDVSIGPSPEWMQHRLTAVGIRPINNVVDVTNYVMIERGQPLHAFDLDALSRPEIVVRRAGARLGFLILDGTTRQLEPDDLLITTGDAPVAIAGIMGGEASGVSSRTRRVLLESAWFHPTTVRRTARRLGLSSESSYRFERTVDVEGVVSALDRAASLLARIAGGAVAPGVIDVYPRPFAAAPIQLRVHRLQELLGIDVDRTRVAAALKALGCSVSSGPHAVLSVVAPSFRTDLTREIDLVEEVARMVGEDQVPATLPITRVGVGDEGQLRRVLRDVRALLAAQGWCEALPVSFSSAQQNAAAAGLTPPAAGPVRLRNPPNQEQTEMRLSLLPGLVDAARHNRDQGEYAVALFCAAKTYWEERSSFREGNRVAGVLYGALPRLGVGQEAIPSEFDDLKGTVEAVLGRFAIEADWSAEAPPAFLHPGKSAVVTHEGVRLGVAGELHPDVSAGFGVEPPCWVFELDVDSLLQYGPRRVFRELPRYPAVVRDLAVLVDGDFVADKVIRFIRGWRTEWVETVRLFDQYRGTQIPAGKKSLAFSITYRGADRTLTDQEVNGEHERLLAALVDRLGVELRR